MTSVFKPLKSVNSLLLIGVMATMGLAATAQPVVPPVGAPVAAPAKGSHHAGERRHDPAKMQAHMAKRQADLKARLKLTPAQEGAWTSYTASTQRPARGAKPSAEQRAEFEKLTTPERIDKMRALRAQRMSEMTVAMDKRDEATKTFYAALTADQKKVFDSQRMGPAGHRQGKHHGPHDKS
ncbi:MAG TPA: Spy/CpxP family protein refolding chaperone [Polaromonas sp.]|uniref:Spy/CpxP family protein refolding chaperone n=1 Tax=Polaromonas sp. TaxID=1869339 RepID=UPI002D48A327|nr:Spy/CpxP family protein refolding chaperone [Polaromonas sp.]HYW55535.1 Spy/CpxP family protein refolding chaperone [Polaromonas sp.]